MEQKSEAWQFAAREDINEIRMPSGTVSVATQNIGIGEEVIQENRDTFIVERKILQQETRIVNEKVIIQKGVQPNFPYPHANLQISASQESCSMEISSQESVISKMDISSQESVSRMDISSQGSDSLELAKGIGFNPLKISNGAASSGKKLPDMSKLEKKTVLTDTSFLNCEAAVLSPDDLKDNSSTGDQENKTRQSTHKRRFASTELPENHFDCATGQKRRFASIVATSEPPENHSNGATVQKRKKLKATVSL